MLTFAELREAAARLRGRVHRTPVFTSKTIGDCAGVELYLKCESFQKTGSFKARGALHKVLRLADGEREAGLIEAGLIEAGLIEAGLITVSAGNHAAATAWAAKQVGAPCTVVMPTDAPRAKIDAVEGYGAEVVLHPDRPTLFDKLHEEQDRRGAKFVHPFDDRDVIAGAATTGLEIVEQVPDVEVVVVPVGGGGLLAGVASAVKALRPDVEVVGVELAEGPGMQPALDAGEPVPVQRPKTFADGMTPPFVGALPLAITKALVDRLTGVTEAEMLDAMRCLLLRCKLTVEAAGAAATAAVLYDRCGIAAGRRVVAVVSGGNVDGAAIAAALTPAR